MDQDANIGNTMKIKKTADMKEYMKEYKKTHKDKWTGKKVCEDCGREYMLNSVTHHRNSAKHKYVVLEKKCNNLEQTQNNLKELLSV